MATSAQALGMTVVGTTRATSRTELVELLTTAHVVSLHCPLTPDTRGMIGRAELAAMPQGALLVNYARGAVIDRPVRSWLLLGCESVLPSAAWLARLCCIFISYRFVQPPHDSSVVSLTAWVDIMLQSPFLSCKPEVCVRCVALDKTLQQNFSQDVSSCCATTVHDAHLALHCDCFITVPACGSAQPG